MWAAGLFWKTKVRLPITLLLYFLTRLWPFINASILYKIHDCKLNRIERSGLVVMSVTTSVCLLPYAVNFAHGVVRKCPLLL
ncbi:hypothetical protein LX36DRAFT_148461 [Colletotrichum falcatum]|nr:hypothetical protein LX36DRAFT_148461 [Colletotrichum falcatum]